MLINITFNYENPGVCLFHMIASCIIDHHEQTASHAERRIEDCHKTKPYNICMTIHSHFPHTSTYISTLHNANGKHNIHHIPYTRI